MVVNCNSFHFFVDPENVLREVRRVLKPDGRLYLTDWNDEYWACWCCDYYLRFTDPAHTLVYSPGEIRALLDSAGFRVESLDIYKIDWLWGLMTVEATAE